MLESLAYLIVVTSGLYLVGLAAACLFSPAHARRFLLGLAQSRKIHFIELFVRILVGVSLVLLAPRMVASELFAVAGWGLLVTSACLLLFPWRWHQRFARHAVPRAVRHVTLIGACSLGFGMLILAAVIGGDGA